MNENLQRAFDLAESWKNSTTEEAETICLLAAEVKRLQKETFDQQSKIHSLEASIFVLNAYLERTTRRKEALEKEIAYFRESEPPIG